MPREIASEPTVFIVDDDPYSRDSIQALVRTMKLNTRTFSCGEDFLDAYRSELGCLVTDLRMPGISGTELLRELKVRHFDLPAVVISAFAEIPVTVEAMQLGAMTLLEKPYHENDLWNAVRNALQVAVRMRQERSEIREIRKRLQLLTPDEEAVMQLVVMGVPNKQISQQLDIGLRTVEARRRRILEKMNVESVAMLVQDVMLANQGARPVMGEVVSVRS